MTRAACLVLVCVATGCATPRPATTMPLADGTNRAFSHTVRIQAPPNTIWRIWTDVERWPEWDIELASASLDGPFHAGTDGRLTPQRGPSSSFLITEVDPGRSYTFETRLPMASLRIRRTWTRADEIRIDITHEVSFHGLMGGVFARRFGPAFRAALPVAMDRLRQLAEVAP